MCVLLIFFGFQTWAQAQEKFGIGIVLGDPSGITAKMHLNRGYLDGVFAYSSGPAKTYYLSSCYLLEKPKINSVDGHALDLYYGIGVRIYEADYDRDRFSRDRRTYIGPKIPLGILTKFKDPSVEVYGEIAFIMDLVPSTGGDIDAGIGARYWF